MGVLLPVWALGMVAGILLSPACIFGYLLTGRVKIGCSQTTWFFVFIIAILLFCIIVLGDFQYAGYKWAYIALGALDPSLVSASDVVSLRRLAMPVSSGRRTGGGTNAPRWTYAPLVCALSMRSRRFLLMLLVKGTVWGHAHT